MTENPTANHIWIIEDETELLDICQDFLKEISPVSCFYEADSALHAFAQNDAPKPTLVVSDIRLSTSQNGLDLMGKMRSSGYDGPFILMSGYGEMSDLVNAISLGVNAFIEKPFEPDYLVQQAREAILAVAKKRQLELTAHNLNQQLNVLRELHQVSHERYVAAENLIYERGIDYDPKSNQRLMLLENIRRENQLSRELEKLQINYSGLLKLIGKN